MIKVAISRLIHCAQGQALDPELENLFDRITRDRERAQLMQVLQSKSSITAEMIQANPEIIDDRYASRQELARLLISIPPLP